MKRLFFALLLLFCVSVEMFADAVKLPGEGVTPTEYLQQMGIEAENYTWTNSAYCKWLQGQTFDFRMHVPEPPLVSVALYYYGNDGTGIWYDFDDHDSFVPFKRSADNSTISITLDPDFEYLYHGAFDSIIIIRLNFYPYKQEDAPLGHDVRNRIKNADFEDGNVEFTSAYNYVEPGTGKLNPEGNYTVDNGLRGNHTIQEKCNSDHTTGKGKFFMANGGSDENTIVLEQHVSPLFDKSYRYLAFSAWVLNWSYPPYAQLQWYVDGQPLGRSELANTRSCEWKRIGTIWTNEKELNEIVLSLRNMQTGKSGNDFAVDDLFFGPVRVQARLDRIILGKKTPTPDTIKIDVCGEDAPTLDDVKKIVWEKCNVTDADLEYPSDAAIRVAMNSGGEITIKKSKEDCDFPADFQGWCSCVTYPEKIIIVNYKVPPTEFTEYTINTCMGATNYKCPWKSSKYTYFTEQGIYYDTIKSYLGCDSLYCKAIVTEKGPLIRNLDTTVCWEDRTGWYSFDVDHNIFLWYIDGQKYHMIPSFDKEYERDEIKTVKNEAGCDSVVYYLHAKWNKAKNIPETIEMCPGKPVYYLVDTGYLEITAPGHYTVELLGPGGANCPDKWDLTVKTFSGVSEVNVNETTCPGTDVTVYPYTGRYGSKAITFENVTKSGLYRDTLRSVWGCDSVIAKINIQVAYAKDTTVYDTICRSHLPTYYFHFPVNQVRSDTVYNLPEILKKEKYFNGSKITTAECTTKVYHLHLHVVECDTIYQDTTVVFGSVVKWIPDPTRPSQYEYFRVNENEFTKEYGVWDGPRGCQTKHYILRVHAYEKANVNTINATICDGDSYTWKRGSGLADSVITPEQYRPYLRSTKVLEFMETVPTDNPKNPIYYYLNLTIQQAVDNPTVYDTICEGETYVWDKGYSVSEYTEMMPSFSINAEGGKVALAPGNLQYCPARDEWRFAERQFDRCLASDNGTVYWNDGGYQKLCDNLAISPTYGGWVDLFAWGTSGKGQRVGDKHTRYFYPYDVLEYDWATYRTDPYNQFGFGPSFDPKFGGSNVWGAGALSNDIDTNSGTNRYFDWGYANEIKEKGKTHKPGTWRTLTLQEWNYLISEREVDGQKNACSYVRLQYGDNATDTVSGVILYPDDFSFARVGVTSIRFGHNDIVVDAATWAKLEKAGCAFLPCTGFVNLHPDGEISTVSDYDGIELYYHMSTIHSANIMYFVYLNISTSRLDYHMTGRNGIFAVRLARDITGNETVEDDGEHASETINMEEGFTEQDYYDTLRSPAGCDLIRSHLHLVVQKSRSNEDHVVLCHNQSTYTWRGKTFEPSFGLNIYRDTVFGSTGCDNEYYIMNAYRRTREDNENRITMCTNSMYKWYTSDPTSPIFIPSPTKDTTYEDFLAYSDGQCDSIRYLLHIKLIKPETKEKYDTICGSETYEWVTSSKNYPRVIHPTTSDTTYRDTLFSSEGCDSIYYILHLKSYIVDRRPPQYDTICNECGPCARKVYSWDRGDGRPPKPVRIDGQDNTYRDTLRYTNGCDSVYYTLHLCNLITKKEQAIKTVCSDEKIYNWYTEGGDFLERIEVKDGTKYYQRKIPFSFTSSCDSLICRLELTHHSVYDTIMYDTICNKEEYEWGRYDSKNYKYEKIRDIRQTTPFEVYRDTIRGASGCDSIITTLKLTRLTSRIEEDTVSLCEGDTYDWYTANKDVVHLNVGAHTQQSADTTYMHRISYTGATSSVCDSVNYRLHVHINFATKRDTTDTILLGQSYSWTTKSSTPTVITPKTAGLIPYSDNAFYTNGCDSVLYTLNLLVQKDSFVYLADTVCAGEKYYWTTYTGHTIDIDQTTTFGDYYDTVFHAGSKRLDSIRYHLHLFRQDYKEKHDTVVLCSNESYTWKYGDKSKLIEAPTTPLTKSTWSEYDDVLSYSDRHHCDSVRCTLHVLRHPPVETKPIVKQRVCLSSLPYAWQPYPTRSIPLHKKGNYEDTIKYVGSSCDSVIYRLQLDVVDTTVYKHETSVCQGQSYSWDDPYTKKKREWTNITQSTSDTAIIKTKDGLCDSVYSIVDIHMLPSSDVVQPDTILCFGSTFEWHTWRKQTLTIDDSREYPYTFIDPYTSPQGCAANYKRTVYVDRADTTKLADTVCATSLPYRWIPSPTDHPERMQELNATGDYTETFANVRGCDSMIYKLHFVVRDTVNEDLKDTICADVTTYEWKTKAGKAIKTVTIPLEQSDYSDTHTVQYKTGSPAKRCDSAVYKLTLYRLPKKIEKDTDTICATQTVYDWYSEGGTFIKRITPIDGTKDYEEVLSYSKNGCDSVHCYLNLTRVVIVRDTLYDTICNQNDYEWKRSDNTKVRDIMQTTSYNAYSDTVRSFVNKCDSVISILYLTRLETRQETDKQSLCEGKTYNWYTTDKRVVHLNVGAHTQMAADTTYIHHVPFSNYAACDSVKYSLDVHIDKVTRRDTTDTILLGQTYKWYTKSTTPLEYTPDKVGEFPYMDKAFYVGGCDSVIYNLTLVVQKDSSVYLSDTVCAGKPYLWKTYKDEPTELNPTEAHTDYYDTVFHAGTKRLDSIRYHLHLFRQDYRNTIDTIVLCSNEEYTWEYDKNDKKSLQIETPTTSFTRDYWDEKTATIPYKNRFGCDSVRCTLHVLRHAPAEVKPIDKQRVCLSSLPYAWQPYPTRSIPLHQKGNYEDTVKYVGSACDSVIYRLQLDVVDTTMHIYEQYLCGGKTEFSWDDPYTHSRRSWESITRSISDTAIVKTKDGSCDSVFSIVKINLSLSKDTVYPDTIMCFGSTFEWNTWRSQKFTLDGRYDYPYKITDESPASGDGCPGIKYEITVKVDKADTIKLADTICVVSKPLPHEWIPSADHPERKQLLYESGDYEEVFTNVRGCDSMIYKLHFVVRDTTMEEVEETLCSDVTTYEWKTKAGELLETVTFVPGQTEYTNTKNKQYETGSPEKRCDSVIYNIKLHRLLTQTPSRNADMACNTSVYNWEEDGVFLRQISQENAVDTHYYSIPYSTRPTCDSVKYELILRRLVTQTLPTQYEYLRNGTSYEWHYDPTDNTKVKTVEQEVVEKDHTHRVPFAGTDCDSVVYKLHLTRIETNSNETSKTLCYDEKFDWYTSDETTPRYTIEAKNIMATDTIYYDTLRSLVTPTEDSIHYVLNVTVHHRSLFPHTDTVSVDSMYHWYTKDPTTPQNIPFTEVGWKQYSEPVYNSNGCEVERYTLDLLWQGYETRDTTDTVCVAELPYRWTPYPGHTRELNQTEFEADYRDTAFHVGTKHIDSVRYKLHLVRLDYKNEIDTVVLCSNENYTWEYDKIAKKSMPIEAPTTPFTDDYWDEITTVIPYKNCRCDSVRCTLHVLRHAPVDVKDVVYQRICLSALPYTWEPYLGRTIPLHKEGNYEDTIKHVGSLCDSVIYKLHLDVVDTTVHIHETSVCRGSDYSLDDPYTKTKREWTNILESIFDTAIIKTEDGSCDSVFSIVHIHMIPATNHVDPDTTLCYGTTFEWRTWRNYPLVIDDSREYPFTFTDEYTNAATGCTGIKYEITVHVDKADTTKLTDTICVVSSSLPYKWTPSPVDHPERTQELYETGDYEEVFTNVRGCDSAIYILHLEVRNAVEEKVEETLCGDVETFEWKTEAGELLETVIFEPEQTEYTNSKALAYSTGSSKYQCDSVVYTLKLHRMLKTKHITTDTLCNASMYEWKTPEGELLRRVVQEASFEKHTHSIPYSTYPSCDSVYYELNLHRLVTKTVPKTDVLCGGDEYIWYYDESDKTKFEVIKQQVPMQDHTHIVPFTGSECDSVIYTLNLLRTETVERTGSKTLCYNDEYAWYTSDLTRPCRVIKSSEIVASDTIFRDTLRCTRFPTCDSIHYILNVHVTRRNTYDTIDTVAINEMYYWYTSDKTNPSKSIYATEAGLQPYEDKVYDANGCEIAHYKLNLLVQGYTEDLKTDTVCAGQEYLWTTKDASNPIRITPTEFEKTYYDTAFYVGSKRIDSVRYVLHLICQSPRVYHDTDYVCSSDVYFWNVGGEEIAITPTEEKEDHTKKLYYTGSKGCDSVIYNLHLIRLDYKEVPLHAKVCFGSVYQWYSDKREFLRNIRQQQQDGEYHEVAYYSGSKRCDSVRYTLYLHVDTVKHELDEATFCKDETYRWLDRNGRLLRQINQTTDAQYYSYISYYSNSCDSIYHTLHLSRLYPSDSITNAVICHGESFNWYGTDYTTPTSETQVLPNSVNCDSLCVLNLSVCSEATEKNLDTIICPNHIVEWRGKILSETGVYRDTLRNKYGCDSIIYIMNAVQHDTTNSMESATLCYQELPYLWHYRYCYEPGIYTDTLLNAQGCDSICYLNLLVSEMIDYCIVDTPLCLNHTMTWHDSIIITERGIYYDTAFNVRGCDRIYYLLNVDTVDCCTHLKNLRLRPLQDVCADDTILNYIFQYTAGLPDSFSVRFKNPDNLELYAKFRDTTGHFALKNINDTWSELPLNKPYLERPRYIRPTGYRVYLDITDTCGTRYQYPFTDSISVYYPHWIIDQHWNDVLALFNSDYNDGYEFSYYQWYRDNEPIFGATRDHYYFPANLSETSDYRALLTRSDDGYTTFTCPVKIVSVADESVLNDQYIYVHPTVVPKDNPTVQIISNLNGNYWIYDMAGKMLSSGGFKSYDETKAATLVTLPAIQSAYFIYLVPDEKRVIKDRSYIILVR